MSPLTGPGVEVSLERLMDLAAHAGIAERTGLSRSDAGGMSGRRRGEGGDLYDLRPFQEGDDPRRIDPAASARSGRTQVRNTHEEVERTVMLVADFRPPMLWGTRGRLRSVAAAEALALEGWRAVAAGGRVGCVVLRGGEAEVRAPRPREVAMLAVAGALARGHAAALEAPRSGAEPLTAGLDQASALVRPGASVIVATGLDDPGPDFDGAAGALLRRCRLEVLLVQDAVEDDPPPGVFAVNVRGQVRRGRLARSGAADRLSALGIPVRIVRAAVADPLEAVA